MQTKLSNLTIFKLLVQLYITSLITSLFIYNIFIGSNKMFFVVSIIDLGFYTILSFALFIVNKYPESISIFFSYIIFSFLFNSYFIYFLINSFSTVNKFSWKVLQNGDKIQQIDKIYEYQENIGSFKAKLLCLIIFFIFQIIFWIIHNRKVSLDKHF